MHKCCEGTSSTAERYSDGPGYGEIVQKQRSTVERSRPSSAGLSSTESRSTVVCCVRTEFGRHYRYIANKGTGDDGMCCEFIAVLRVRDQEESTLS